VARKIVITSGKGGVGKTTICGNLGSFLARQNYKVALLDLDIGLNNLDVVLGIENKIVFDIVDVVCNRCRAKQALLQDSNTPSLYIMPSAQTHIKLTKNDVAKVIADLDDYFDYILVDCPAGIDEGFHRAVACCDEALVVVTPHISSIRDADKVISILSSYRLTGVYGIVNRVRGDLIVNKEMLSIEDIFDLLRINLVGVIPDDDMVSINSGIGGAIYDRCHAFRAFELLTSNIIQGTYKIYDCTMSYRGFFGAMKRKLKRKI